MQFPRVNSSDKRLQNCLPFLQRRLIPNPSSQVCAYISSDFQFKEHTANDRTLSEREQAQANELLMKKREVRNMC